MLIEIAGCWQLGFEEKHREFGEEWRHQNAIHG
jgi:hypothetical protein